MKKAELYPNNAAEKLELDKLIAQLRTYCTSVLGERFVDRLSVSSDFDFISKALNQVKEFKELVLFDQAFPGDHYLNLEEELNYLEIKNSVLSEEQYLQLKDFLRTIRDIYFYFGKRKEKYPALQNLIGENEYEQAPLKAIDHVISDEGQVRSGISPVLDKVRKEITAKEREIEKKFQSLMQKAGNQGWLADASESMKNGRRVLTVLAEHKRKLKGIIHDESATGKTVFIEPEETVELSNDLFELRQEERREIYRILRELGDEIRPHIPVIRRYQWLAGIFDFIRAKSLLAIQLKCDMPQLENAPVIDLIKAVHPLLFIHNEKLGRDTVPLNLKLDNNKRILVISGPNAGGKSVALKTIGLLQIMLQSGMLVPVYPDSVMGVFRKIFVELGDEQSIENDLSTYSSHLQHMKHFTEKADKNTLFLIDEFGTGTDPKFGGAIAEAVLEALNGKKAFGAVTTHYSNLKVYATQTPEILNGCMLFDLQSLNPLYVLKTGQPGSSYAFEIAGKIGLPPEVVSSAREKIDKDYESFDTLLASMETDKYLLEMQQKKLESGQKELDSLMDSYSRLKEDLEENKKKILLETRQRSLQQLEETNRLFENTLRDVKEKAARQDTSKTFRKQMDKEQQKLKEEIKQLNKKAKPAKPEKEALPIKEGAMVRWNEGSEIGVVEEIRKNKALVAFKTLKTLIKIDELEVLDASASEQAKRFGSVNYGQHANEFTPNLDLRGKRVEEALGEVEQALDKALLLNYPFLRILHGKGNGILRKAIWEMLKKYDFVKEFRSENPDFGGEGITLVELG